MANDRPITAEQALLAVKAAGLDPDKPLSDQLGTSDQVDDQTVGAGAEQPSDPQPHELLAKRLHDAQSRWLTLGGPDGEAA